MNKRFFLTLLTLVIIAVGTGIGVLMVKGYRISPTTGTVANTGIIAVTSEPDGASVFVDDHLTSATNANISNLSPKEYTVKVVKEGYIPWEKKINVRAGLVSEVKITLFPSIPTIYPLTYNGVESPTLSSDGEKLAFVAPIATQSATLRQKGGIWVYQMSDAPIAFNRSSGLRQLLISSSDLDFSKASLRFSPDSKQLLIGLTNRNYLVSAESPSNVSDLRDITPSLEATTKGWDDEVKLREETKILAIKNLQIQKVASDSASIKWSPDETKFMYAAKGAETSKMIKALENSDVLLAPVKVYDMTENKSYDLPEALNYVWLPDSRHIILVEQGSISLVELDGSNKSVIYAGSFINNLVFPWPDSSKLVVLSSVPTPTASQPNLFGINLK